MRGFFAQEIPEELNHAQILADKISALGGTPAAEPKPVKGAKQVLENALEAEIGNDRPLCPAALGSGGGGEFGLAAQFDDILMDETHHRDELKQMLARWP